MTVDNEARLTADIRVELAAYSPGSERVTWLYEHLELYIRRWEGFSTISAISMSSIIKGDLHTILLAAIHLINEELALMNSDRRLSKWSEFTEYVRGITPECDRSIAKELIAKWEHAYSELRESFS